ncbi:hypothetical protein DXG01_003431 [Tephrocybe rancida]|nr:hypothetical protein DXG01_003431 [Tephrocybe rancida]
MEAPIYTKNEVLVQHLHRTRKSVEGSLQLLEGDIKNLQAQRGYMLQELEKLVSLLQKKEAEAEVEKAGKAVATNAYSPSPGGPSSSSAGFGYDLAPSTIYVSTLPTRASYASSSASYVLCASSGQPMHV